MRISNKIFNFLIVVLLFPTHSLSQDNVEEWDVTLARGKTRDISFETNEGTWMSVDISPNGKWIVFDLLAHIYRVPSKGGKARVLTQETGVAINYHPRYSPDGKSIAFISDRAGQNNLWIMDADGSNPRSIFEDLNLRASHPTWTPDSEYIIVSRQSVLRGPSRGRDSGIYMYHRNGGKGIKIGGKELQGAKWPSVSEDGKYLYFHLRTPGQTVAWNVSDILQGAINIRRYEFDTGEITPVTSGDPTRQLRLSSGGAYAPEISPDGRWLAFARRIPDGTITWKGHEFGPRTALWLRDLLTGDERVIMDPIEQDMTEGMKTLRVLPAYSWDAKGNSIILSQGGKLRRLNVKSGKIKTIPFTASVKRTISEQAYKQFDISDEPFKVQFTRYHVGAPNGSAVAFQAVGKIYIMSLPNGTPKRLTNDNFREFEYTPTWSPDGKWIAFVSVDETGAGHLWKVRSTGGSPTRLSNVYGEYIHPTWSSDGKQIALVRGSGATARTRTMIDNPYYDILTIASSGGKFKEIARVPVPVSFARSQFVRPSFGKNNRIFFPQMGAGRGDSTRLISVNNEGKDKRTHFTFPHADEVMISPESKWVTFNEGDNIYLVPMPFKGLFSSPIAIDKKDGKGALPVKKLSDQGGIHPSWLNETTVQFGSGSQYFTYNIESSNKETHDINLVIPRNIPQGTIVLSGARILTMDNRKVIDNGDIVINKGRISCLGECDKSNADKIVDLRGKTIIPGLIDMHSHFYREYRGIIPMKTFEASVPLAYGVTSNLDNSMWSQDVFPAAEMIESGALIGSRTYSTGDPLYAGDGPRQNELTSYQITEDNIKRLSSWGAVSLKQYMQPQRKQRQWVSDIARKYGLMVTSEGSDLHYNLSMIMDGQTAWEHPISYMPMYSDAAKFFGKAKTVYSPTFMVGGSGPWNDEYFFAQTEVWKDEKLRLWMPWQQLMPHSRRRELRPDTDYSYPFLAQVLADIMEEGGHGAIGSHGQQHGIASHWEVWVAASAMGPMGALELGTNEGAYFLGAQNDVGSLAKGKLADLIVLNSNPLDDIKNTLDIKYVMKGGILYDGFNLDEIWPEKKKYGERPWINEDALRQDSRPINN